MNLEGNISKLRSRISAYEISEILKLISGALLQISDRDESPLLKGLFSPQRQLIYLGSLRLTCTEQGTKSQPTEEEWNDIKQLLVDIEMSYFYSIGFPNKGNETIEDIDKIKIALPTFMNYYFNGSLAYQEQQIEQIERIYEPFNNLIKKELNVTIDELISFYYTINDQINLNLNNAIHFFNPEKWQEFTSDCISKGFDDPKDWIGLAPKQLEYGMKFIHNPGHILVINTNEEISQILSKGKINLIFDIFCSEINPTIDPLYYTEVGQFGRSPFWKISNNEYLVFYIRQYLESLDIKLKEIVEKHKKIELLSSRDKYAEVKMLECLHEFFGEKAKIYSNYGLNNLEFEQDILVVYKSIAIIIEVKAGTYRAPMRDPLKAYNKIKSDFKSTIKNGLDQADRVAKHLNGDGVLKLIAPNKSTIDSINCANINSLYSVVLTKERFGHIQTNLIELVPNIDDYTNPMSMCYEDFEVILLMLKQNLNPLQSLVSYLDSRPKYHGHLLCGDEMELFGYYLSNKEDYYRFALRSDTLVTHIDNTDPIDECYSNGMGFKNEVNLQKKNDKQTGILFKKKRS